MYFLPGKLFFSGRGCIEYVANDHLTLNVQAEHDAICYLVKYYTVNCRATSATLVLLHIGLMHIGTLENKLKQIKLF